MFFNLALENIVPLPPAQKDENFELISENTGETVTVLDRTTDIYSIFPSDKPTESISVAFDASTPIDNQRIFEKLFEMVLASEGNSGFVGAEIPKGLIMNVTLDGVTAMEAIKIDATSKTININYSFTIQE